MKEFLTNTMDHLSTKILIEKPESLKNSYCPQHKNKSTTRPCSSQKQHTKGLCSRDDSPPHKRFNETFSGKGVMKY